MLASYKLASVRASDNWDAIIPTVESNNQIITTSIIIHNAKTSDATVKLKIKNGGSEYPIFKALVRREQTLYIAENIILLQGDSLLINADVTNISVVCSADKSVTQ